MFTLWYEAADSRRLRRVLVASMAARQVAELLHVVCKLENILVAVTVYGAPGFSKPWYQWNLARLWLCKLGINRASTRIASLIQQPTMLQCKILQRCAASIHVLKCTDQEQQQWGRGDAKQERNPRVDVYATAALKQPNDTQ
jgi:hypothetical protein